MNKISIIGLDSTKQRLIKELMDLGVVEISSQDSKLTDSEWMSYIERDGNENEVLKIESEISKVHQVLQSLDKYDRNKKPMFNLRKVVSDKDFEKAIFNKDKIEENVNSILMLGNQINELNTEENKTVSYIMSLRPWVNYKLPFELNETRFTSIFLGVVPGIVSVEKLIADIETLTDRCYIDLIGSDKDQYYLSIICLKNEKEEVFDILKQYSFNSVSFKDIEGTAAENIAEYEKRISGINKEREELESQISSFVNYKFDIQLLYDYMIIEKDKSKILCNMLKTDKTFYASGWIPAKSKESIEAVLKQNECWYEINEPEEDEQYPILLSNNSLIKPLEMVTELYSLPSSSNVDPTSSMWFFFFAFFGLMLGDAGYGLIMIIIGAVILKKYKVEGSILKAVKLLLFAGISTAFWGVMFGSWFGDSVAAGAKVMFNVDFLIKPLWLNPLEEPLTLLIFSFAFGAIHLFVGLGVKAYMLIRDGHPWDALFDVGFWYAFILGPTLLLLGDSLFPGAGNIGKWLTIIGVGGLILTQGRDKKGIISKLISGVLSLYGITGYLSDVLSYSRLLALGLATGVVSSVLSIIGSMGGSSIVGKILFIAVFTFGHTFNFAINALGAFVHSARLQYVEFFGKFYEGGGEAFNPLIKNTKYIKIIKEEN